MSQARLDVSAARHILSRKFRYWLNVYRPRFRDRRFWMVQVLVIGIAAIHDIVEAGGFLPHFVML